MFFEDVFIIIIIIIIVISCFLLISISKSERVRCVHDFLSALHDVYIHILVLQFSYIIIVRISLNYVNATFDNIIIDICVIFRGMRV